MNVGALDKLGANVESFFYNPFSAISSRFITLFSANPLVNYDFTSNIADFDRLFLLKNGPTECGTGITKCIRAVIEEKFDGVPKSFMTAEYVGFRYEATVQNAIAKKLEGVQMQYGYDEVLQ